MADARRLWKYLRHYRLQSVVGPLFKLLEAVFELIVPILMARLIDEGVNQNNPTVIFKTAGWMVAMGALGLTCSITAQFFAARAAMGFGAEVRSALLSRIASLSHAQLDRLGASTLLTRLTADVDRAQAGVNMTLRLLLRSPFIVAGALVMAIALDRPMGLIFLLATPLAALMIYWVTKRTLPMYRGIQARVDRLSLLARESLRGVRVIRAFSRQADEAARFDGEAEGMQKAQLAAGLIAALGNPMTYAVANLSIAALLWFGGRRVDAGLISQGEMVALINYMSQILLALAALTALIVVIVRALASAARLGELMAIEPSMADGAGAAPVVGAPRVAFENVSFRYAGAQGDALADATFSVGAGRMVGVIGGTGAGKSTLIHLIPRFYDATSGRVLVDGADVKDWKRSELRRKIGVVPQKPSLFTGTVRYNLTLDARDATDDALWRALQIAQAEDFVAAREGGLDARLEQGGANLSGGQKQRLAIARALVGEPDLLILDDSASALDYLTELRLRRALKSALPGAALVVVSQRASSVRDADLILVLEEGRVAASGTHDELMQSCQIYRDIASAQAPEEVGAI